MVNAELPYTPHSCFARTRDVSMRDRTLVVEVMSAGCGKSLLVDVDDFFLEAVVNVCGM